MTQSLLSLPHSAHESALPLYPFQREALDAVYAARDRGVRRQVISIPTGGGKCLGIGTPVLTYDGNVVPVEDVRAGDTLMGPDGTPRRVLSTTYGHGPLYRVVPVKGEPWVCNDVHVLTLVHTETGALVDIPLDEYLKRTRWWKHCHKQFAPGGPIEFPATDQPLSVSPYFLGIWLGDGSKDLRGVAISKPDAEIEAAVRVEAERWGLEVRTDCSKSCPTFHVHGKRGMPNPLLAEMRRLMRDGSNIPHHYLTASIADRLELLAGLLDTDGYNHNGSCEIIQLRPQFATGIAFLARSLGLRALLSEKVVGGTTYVRVSIAGDLSTIPLRIPRKGFSVRRQKKVATRTGFTVSPIGEGEYAGFELDGDGRFLLGDFTVTHNTVVAAHLVAELGKPTVFMVHRDELVRQTIDKFAMVDPGLSVAVCKAEQGRSMHELAGRDVVVASAQTLAQERRLHVLREAVGAGQVLIVDECHHAAAPTWQRAIDTLAPSLCVGLSATPKRGDGKALDGIFEEIVYGVPMATLVNLNLLARPVGIRVGTSIDLDAVGKRQGDFAVNELEEAVNVRERNQLVVDAWRKYASDRKHTIAFCVDIDHTVALTEAFLDAGVNAAYVIGATPPEARARIYRDFRSGEVAVLISCMVLTEGFDEPSVDCALMCRPTQSQALYIQMAGRALRKHDGKPDSLVIDFVDVTRRHKLQTILSLTGDGDPEIDDQAVVEGAPLDLFEAIGAAQEKRARVGRDTELVGDLLHSSPFVWHREGLRLFAPIGNGSWLSIVNTGDGYIPIVVTDERGKHPLFKRLFERPVDVVTAMNLAERTIPRNYITDRQAEWRHRASPATDGQHKAANFLRIRLPEECTKGQASELIDRGFFERAYGRSGAKSLEAKAE